MAANARMYWLHALTPLHVGAGRGVGYIDLPITREKVTGWPLVPGSAVKGVFRDTHEQAGTPDFHAAFGTAGDEHSNSGSLVITDARIACLPVRSFHGTFAWCASPLSLGRLARDLESAGILAPPAVAQPPAEYAAWVTSTSKLRGADSKVLLEDLDLDAKDSADANSWADAIAARVFADEAHRRVFKERFLVLPDDVFDFLSETATEVVARVKILDNQKTVAPGGLWYEESLPVETILGGVVWCDRIFGARGGDITPARLLDAYCRDEALLQIGGKGTVGRGRVRCVFSDGGK